MTREVNDAPLAPLKHCLQLDRQTRTGVDFGFWLRRLSRYKLPQRTPWCATSPTCPMPRPCRANTP